MQPEFADIYQRCRDLLKTMEVASTSIMLQPDKVDSIASEQLGPPTTALENLLRTHEHALVRALGQVDTVRCFGCAGATAPDAILKFAKEFVKLCLFHPFLPYVTIYRKGMNPLRAGLDDARSRLLIEEAGLGASGPAERSRPRTLELDPKRRMTRSEIAKQLGVSEDRVRGWTRRKQDPLAGVGTRGNQPLYDLREAERILQGDLPGN